MKICVVFICLFLANVSKDQRLGLLSFFKKKIIFSQKRNYFKVAYIYGVTCENLIHLQSGGDQISLISVSSSWMVICFLGFVALMFR